MFNILCRKKTYSKDTNYVLRYNTITKIRHKFWGKIILYIAHLVCRFCESANNIWMQTLAGVHVQFAWLGSTGGGGGGGGGFDGGVLFGSGILHTICRVVKQCDTASQNRSGTLLIMVMCVSASSKFAYYWIAWQFCNALRISGVYKFCMRACAIIEWGKC